MNPVIHFEMPYEDRDRAGKFYEEAFGWKTEKYGEDMGYYLMLTTLESDVVPDRPRGGINGGMFPKSSDGAPHYPSLVIGVKDINASMEKVRAAGGKIIGEPTSIPGVGLYVHFVDTEGNKNGMIQ